MVKEPDFLGSFTAALRDPVMQSRCAQALNRSLKPNPFIQCMLNQTPNIVEINGKAYAVFKGASGVKGE